MLPVIIRLEAKAFSRTCRTCWCGVVRARAWMQTSMSAYNDGRLPCDKAGRGLKCSRKLRCRNKPAVCVPRSMIWRCKRWVSVWRCRRLNVQCGLVTAGFLCSVSAYYWPAGNCSSNQCRPSNGLQALCTSTNLWGGPTASASGRS